MSDIFSLPNCFHTCQGPCFANLHKWGLAIGLSAGQHAVLPEGKGKGKGKGLAISLTCDCVAS